MRGGGELMRRIAFWFLWAFIVSIPVDHALQLGGSFGSIARVLGLAAAAVGIFAALASKSIRRPAVMHMALMLFLGWVVVGLLWTSTEDETLTAIRTLLQTSVTVFLIWEFASDRESQDSLCVAYLTGCCLSIVSLVSGMGVLTGGMRSERATIEGWNENDIALVLALGVAISASLINSDKRWRRYLAFAYLLLAPIGVLLTASRGGSIVLALAYVLMVIQLGKRSAAGAVFTVLLLASGVYGLLAIIPDAAVERVLSVLNTWDLNSRGEIWQAGLLALQNHPIVGVGAGGFLQAAGANHVAHNTFLSVLVEEGLIGFALFASVLLVPCVNVTSKTQRDLLFVWGILFCWAVGVSALTWEQVRTTWFIIGLAGARAYVQNPSEEMFTEAREQCASL